MLIGNIYKPPIFRRCQQLTKQGGKAVKVDVSPVLMLE